MNLESQYQLAKASKPGDSVSRKAGLYSLFPVREMLRRGWIQASENLEVLEQRFSSFFSIPHWMRGRSCLTTRRRHTPWTP
ncbi:hypothetical protein Ddc_22201 [Ditylenchus destructor]|nr:hypothetical protein Ddc_22201 [Ditylenchus destructor]